MVGTRREVSCRTRRGVKERVDLREAALLPFETFLLYREPPSRRGQENMPGLYWFETMKRHASCESRLELRVLQELDFDPRVSAVAAQPFKLVLPLSGRKRRHVSGFFVRRSSGPDRVVDVKLPREAFISSISPRTDMRSSSFASRPLPSKLVVPLSPPPVDTGRSLSFTLISFAPSQKALAKRG